MSRNVASRTSSATETDPSEFRRVTRMQTRAAREKIHLQTESPIEIKEDPVIQPTRYPIRRQQIPIEEFVKRSPTRKPKKGKPRNTSKPKLSVTPQCELCGVTNEQLQQMSKPANNVARKPRTRNKRVQTEQSITDKEMKLIQSLREKRIDIEKIKIISDRRQSTLIKAEVSETETDVEEVERTVRYIPAPLVQMPTRLSSSSPSDTYTRQMHNLFIEMFQEDIARFARSVQNEQLHQRIYQCSNNPLHILHNGGYSQIINHAPNLNRFELPRWSPRPSYYPYHTPGET